MVINYDVPDELEIYIERMNRACGSSRSVVINLAEEKDMPFIQAIEKQYSIKMQEMPLKEDVKEEVNEEV
ncbi:unnamed protein product [Meloidogyne enterolobii]